MSEAKTCREVVEVLMDYVAGALAAEDQAMVEAHLRECPRCVEFLESYRATPRVMREATASRMPEELRVALRRFLDERKRTSSD